MRTIVRKTDASASEQENVGVVRSVRRRISTVLVAVAFLVAGSTAPAFAVDSTDPTGGAGDTVINGLKTYVTGHLITVAFGLLLVLLAAGMAAKWAGKFSKR
ncbi:MAG: hypothetical protein JWO22_2027 [Frankiales bacterium]|nr:hypothetical protein [Frankiales bacterium]